jgi:hypothetical protein
MDRAPHNLRDSKPTVTGVCDRRKTSRIQVRFRTLMSANGIRLEVAGTVLELSMEGCRIRASVPVSTFSSLDLQINIPDLDWTLFVDDAIVQWVKEDTFGLRFTSVRPTDGDRLAWIIARTAKAKE